MTTDPTHCLAVTTGESGFTLNLLIAKHCTCIWPTNYSNKRRTSMTIIGGQQNSPCGSMVVSSMVMESDDCPEQFCVVHSSPENSPSTSVRYTIMSAHCMCLAHAHQQPIFFNLNPVYQAMIRPVHKRSKNRCLGTRLGHDMLTVCALGPFWDPLCGPLLYI